MRQLIEGLIIPAFSSGQTFQRHDGAVLSIGNTQIAFTTDSYVVHPLFFPGGDIGKLAVHGTVNDLAMCGAKPLYLSCGFILEEGLPMEVLSRVVASMQTAAQDAGVQLVTGDTKVVDRGKADGLYVNTAGIGVLEHNLSIGPSSVQPGDGILINGDLGRHGIAIMAVREGLSFESAIESDTAPLWNPVKKLLDAGVEIHCLRDLTRGGLASALNEIAEDAKLQVSLEEAPIPVHPEVQGACEILGLDPLYVANEGRFCAFVKASDVPRALSVLQTEPSGTKAAVIGKVEKSPSGSGQVTIKTRLGSTRLLDLLSGEQLPRIC